MKRKPRIDVTKIWEKYFGKEKPENSKYFTYANDYFKINDIKDETERFIISGILMGSIHI